MKQGQRRILLPLLVLLLASHAVLFFIARGRTASNRSIAPTPQPAAAKSRERDAADSAARGHDLSAAFLSRLRELEQTPLSELSQQDFLTARRELFREWLLRDPRSAFDHLFSPLEDERLKDVSSNLKKEIEEAMALHPRDTWFWIDAGRYGSLTPVVMKKWLGAMMKDGQGDLVIDVLPRVPSYSIDDWVEELCRDASPARLARIRSFLFSPRGLEGRNHRLMLDHYAQRIAALPGATADQLLATETEPRLRGRIAAQWASRELGYLPAADAAQGVAALPRDTRGAALQEMVYAKRRGGYGANIDLLEELDTRQLFGSMTGQRREKIVSTLVHSYEEAPLEDIFTAVATRLSNPALRDAVLTDVARDRACGNEDQLFESLPRFPAGPARDHFLATVAPYISTDDPRMDQLIAAISDPALAAELRKEREDSGEEMEEEDAPEPMGEGE